MIAVGLPHSLQVSFFLFLPHVQEWYGRDLFWSVSGVCGRRTWPTHPSAGGHGVLRRAGSFARDGSDHAVLRIFEEWVTASDDKYRRQVFNWWRKHPSTLELVEVPLHSIPKSRMARDHYCPIADQEPAPAEAVCTTFASKRARGLCPKAPSTC